MPHLPARATRLSWGLRTAAVGLVASAGGLALPTVAAASGTAKLVHVTSVGGATSQSQNLVLTGGIGDAGTLDINGPTDTITLSRGSLTVDLTKAEAAENKLFGRLKALVNPSTCSMNASYTAPVKVVNGTGSYAGLQGTLVVRTAEIGVFPRTASGTCNVSSNAQPVGFLSIGTGAGTLRSG